MTDPSRVGAERLAANMESYLASIEISHGRREDQRQGCWNPEVMWLLGKRGWSWDCLEERRWRILLCWSQKCTSSCGWVTELPFLERAWCYGNNQHGEVTAKGTGGKAVNQGSEQSWKGSAQSWAKYKQEQGVGEQEKSAGLIAGELERRNTEQCGAGTLVLTGVKEQNWAIKLGTILINTSLCSNLITWVN